MTQSLATVQPMLAGLFTAIATLTVPNGVDLIQTSGHGVRGRGAARYTVGATGDAPAAETPYSTNTANGRPVTLNEFVATLEMFGTAGDGASDDTVPVNAAMVWSSYPNYRPVHAESPTGYAIDYVEFPGG